MIMAIERGERPEGQITKNRLKLTKVQYYILCILLKLNVC